MSISLHTPARTMMALALLAATSVGRAEISIGQEAPQIGAAAWLNAKGKPSLAGLRGKIAVIEFWATWCPPCRKSIPHLNQLHQQWSRKGVVIIGLTQEHKSVVTNFMKSQPMHYVIGTGSRTSGQYGVRGIPHAYVLDPKGRVVWHGHPMSGLDQALAQAYQNTPPTLLSAKELKKLEAKLDAATQDFQNESYRSALSVIEQVTGQVPEAHPLYTRAQALQDQITQAGQAQLDQARASIQAGKPAEAARVLAKIRLGFKDHQLGQQADQEIHQLNADPQTAALIQAAHAQETARVAEQASEKMLQDAQSMIDGKDYAQAHAKLKHIADTYSQTDAAKRAQEKTQQLMADPDIAAAIVDQRAKKECVGWLRMARNYSQANRPAHARSFYQRIIEGYPQSSYAQIAQHEMTAMQQQP